MSEATDQPAPAGVDATAVADDIDTETFDRQEAPADDAEPTDPPEVGEEKADPEAPDPSADDVEIDVNGRKVKVPREVALAQLRHADYTKKTTEVAEAKKALEAERQTFEQQRQDSLAALPEEHSRLAILNHNIAAVNAALDKPVDSAGLKLRDINWAAFRERAQADPERYGDSYRTLRGRYDSLRESLTDLNDTLGQAKTDLQTKEADRLAKQQEAHAADLAKRVEETAQALIAEIPGWNGQKAVETATLMTEFGVTPDEVAEATDPRLWKMAHALHSARAETAKLQAALKQHTTATNHAKAQTTQPAESGKGGSASAARDPATPRGDGLSTEAWMKRRNAQKAR